MCGTHTLYTSTQTAVYFFSIFGKMLSRTENIAYAFLLLTVLFFRDIGSQGACVDKLPNCKDFSSISCTIFVEWARDNCATTCGVCKTTTTTLPPPTTLAQEMVCADRITSCNTYSKGLCTSFPGWAKENCAKMCGVCKVPPTPMVCIDKLATCKKYSVQLCKTLPEWAEKNCPVYCGLCKTTPEMTISTTTATTRTKSPIRSPDVCFDKLTNCDDYNAETCTIFSSWATANCAKTCGTCNITPQTTPSITTSTIARTTATTIVPTTVASTSPVAISTTSPEDVCKDINSACETAPFGCNRGYAYAVIYCRKFCGFCTAKTPPPPTTTKTPVLPCEEGWSHYRRDGTCIKVFGLGKSNEKERRNWVDSKQTCAAHASTLVHIKDKEKNKFVYEMAGDILTPAVWIGLKNVALSGYMFKWADGTLLKYDDFHPWLQGNPDDLDGHEKCVHLRTEGITLGLWNDFSCVFTLPFVCSKNTRKLY